MGRYRSPLKNNEIVEEDDSEKILVPIAPNSDPDIKAIVIAVLRRINRCVNNG